MDGVSRYFGKSVGRRRGQRRLRAFLYTVGGVGLGISSLFALLSLSMKNSQLLLWSGGYMALSLLFLLIAQILRAVSQARRNRAYERRIDAEEGMRSGFALVLVIVLIGTVSVLTVSSQILTAQRLRHARAKSLHSSLRISASDAAWRLVQGVVGGGDLASGVGASNPSVVLPSGARTQVSVSGATNMAGGALSMLAQGSGQGDLYIVQASASVSGAAEQVVCFVRQDGSNCPNVLGWFEGR